MSNTDYTIYGLGALCPVAELDGAVSYMDSAFTLKNLVSVGPEDRFVGMALLIDDEICKVISISIGSIGVERGCADTVPAPHDDESLVWFFDTNYGIDNRTYSATEEIGVKLLPFTNSGGPVPIDQSPPQELQFDFRFARPYPPAAVYANSARWYLANPDFDFDGDDIEIVWTDRDRIVQADILIGHDGSGITIEPGTTYTIRVYDEDDVLVSTHAGISTSSYTYSFMQAVVDFEIEYDESATSLPCKLVLCSTRDGLDSYQDYTINFLLNRSMPGGGWGFAWGHSFGST